jgi:hypothetical protein
MFRITECLSIGPFASPERAIKLRAAGVTHVLNVSDGPSEISKSEEGFKGVAWVPMSDSRRLMPSTAVWALSTLHQLVTVPDAHAYVHCVAGLVRSPTILWLYLIACGLSSNDARDLIRVRAPKTDPGSSSMVDHEHVRLARTHGLVHFSPHPRPNALTPFPIPEEVKE